MNVDFRLLELGSVTLSVGGVRDLRSITSRPGQVETQDFVGCVRSMRVEGIDLLFNEPQRQLGITDTCPRMSSEGQCAGSACSEHAQCVDRWDRATCTCQSGWSGVRCNKGKSKSLFSVKRLILCN